MISDYMWGKQLSGTVRVLLVGKALTAQTLQNLVGTAGTVENVLAQTQVTATVFGLKKCKSEVSALVSHAQLHMDPSTMELSVVAGGQIVGVVFLLMANAVVAKAVYMGVHELEVSRHYIGADDIHGVVLEVSA